jgi:hypothetical protein
MTPSSFLINVKLESKGEMVTTFPVGPITDFRKPQELTVPTGLPEVREVPIADSQGGVSRTCACDSGNHTSSCGH